VGTSTAILSSHREVPFIVLEAAALLLFVSVFLISSFLLVAAIGGFRCFHSCLPSIDGSMDRRINRSNGIIRSRMFDPCSLLSARAA
jgi:hypothetical protein